MGSPLIHRLGVGLLEHVRLGKHRDSLEVEPKRPHGVREKVCVQFGMHDDGEDEAGNCEVCSAKLIGQEHAVAKDVAILLVAIFVRDHHEKDERGGDEEGR